MINLKVESLWHIEKGNHFFIALFLLCTVFANSALAGACFCGQACMHGLQPKAKIKGDLPFHMRCTATLCESCDLEKMQTFRAANSAAADAACENP